MNFTPRKQSSTLGGPTLHMESKFAPRDSCSIAWIHNVRPLMAGRSERLVWIRAQSRNTSQLKSCVLKAELKGLWVRRPLDIFFTTGRDRTLVKVSIWNKGFEKVATASAAERHYIHKTRFKAHSGRVGLLRCDSGANPTITSYNASVEKNYNGANS
jgi:hypothetical protein